MDGVEYVCGSLDVNVPGDLVEINEGLGRLGYVSMRLKRPHWPVTKKQVESEVWELCFGC